MIKSKADKNVTLIAADTSVDGHLRFAGELYVNGSVNGDIEAGNESQGTLVISAEGMVKGEIRVPSAVIGGTVEGDVHAGVRLEVASTARLAATSTTNLSKYRMGPSSTAEWCPRSRRPRTCMPCRSAREMTTARWVERNSPV